MKDMNIEWMMDKSPTTPADAAVTIVKAGALRIPRLYFHYLETRPLELFCNIFPETINSMFRKLMSYGE